MFTALGGVWGEGGWWSNWQGVGVSSTPLDVIKASLTTIGGVGGTAYLVIRYRERASAERAEAEHKLLNAVQQLGSESPQVRIAGVYALADVADTYRGGYRQRVVNILCGYLRTQRGEWKTIVNEQDRPKQSSEEKVYVSQDGAVESTALEVLGRHLRKRHEKADTHGAVSRDVEDDQLWCDCTIDLHDAVITESLNFTDVTLASDASFQGATFNTFAIFQGASFDAHVTFRGATFNYDAHFERATFKDDAHFERATFKDDTSFWGATFNYDAYFERATFKDDTYFSGATFNDDAHFERATFKDDTSFSGAAFNDDAHFERATFKDDTSFSGATFNANTSFRGATFNRAAPPTGIPRKLVDHETGLPKGARWARFKDKSEVIEEGSPEPDKPSDAAGSS